MLTNKLCQKPVKTKFKKNRDVEFNKIKQQNRRDKNIRRLLRQEQESEYVIQRQFKGSNKRT